MFFFAWCWQVVSRNSVSEKIGLHCSCDESWRVCWFVWLYAHEGLKVHLKNDCEESASQHNTFELISFFWGLQGRTAHRSWVRCIVVLLLHVHLPMHRSEQTIVLQVHYVVLSSRSVVRDVAPKSRTQGAVCS